MTNPPLCQAVALTSDLLASSGTHTGVYGLTIASAGVAAIGLAVDSDEAAGRWMWVATGFASVAVLVALWLHWRLTLWDTFGGKAMVRDYVDDATVDEEAMLRDLALHGDDLWAQNEAKLRRRRDALLVLIVAVVLELGAIIVALTR